MVGNCFKAGLIHAERRLLYRDFLFVGRTINGDHLDYDIQHMGQTVTREMGRISLSLKRGTLTIQTKLCGRSIERC